MQWHVSGVFLTFAATYVPLKNITEPINISESIVNDFEEFLNDYTIEYNLPGEAELEKFLEFDLGTLWGISKHPQTSGGFRPHGRDRGWWLRRPAEPQGLCPAPCGKDGAATSCAPYRPFDFILKRNATRHDKRQSGTHDIDLCIYMHVSVSIRIFSYHQTQIVGNGAIDNLIDFVVLFHESERLPNQMEGDSWCFGKT